MLDVITISYVFYHIYYRKLKNCGKRLCSKFDLIGTKYI